MTKQTEECICDPKMGMDGSYNEKYFVSQVVTRLSTDGILIQYGG